jgi:hypothetical protein
MDAVVRVVFAVITAVQQFIISLLSGKQVVQPVREFMSQLT